MERTIVEERNPRSYVVQTSKSVIRQNRRHLNPLPNIVDASDKYNKDIEEPEI